MDYERLAYCCRERSKREMEDATQITLEEAATAITGLLARAEAAEARAEKAERERDAAIADIAAILAEVEKIRRGYGVDNADADNAFANLCGNYCAKCGNNCYEEAENYRCKNYEWRGMKEA